MFVPLPPAAAAGIPEGRVILFKESKIYLQPAPDGGMTLPDASHLELDEREYLVVGSLNGRKCAAAFLDRDTIPGGTLEELEMRIGLDALPEAERIAAGRARELLFWRQKRRFCGECGAPTRPNDADSGVVCTKCGAFFYPVLAPAVIVAIRRGNGLLLAHNSRWQPGLYGLISGFIEAGENAEQAIRREIREEVGLEVTNIRYAGSQSWPFPNALMLGFVADYASGEIKVDGAEITDAAFFTADAMPMTPPPGSIAHNIIKAFKAGELV